MMPMQYVQVSPCLNILKYGKCASKVMVGLCIHLKLADVIANVIKLKYVVT